MNFWDERYDGDEYAYGTSPNDFLVSQAARLAGPVLSLAEGEGRNAVYLAGLGLEVLGVDASAVGLAKARRLAAERGVLIRVEVADLAVYAPPSGAFGAVVSIFAHMPSAVREGLHARVRAALRSGGCFLLEAYSPAQLARATGGPRDADLLPTAEELRRDFAGWDLLVCRETERPVVEGRFHTGMAAVVQFLARKP